MAQNYAIRPVTRLSESAGIAEPSVHTYVSLLALTRLEFIDRLKHGKFTDIQGFCKAVDVSAKGARTELESRLLEYKDHHDARVVPSVIPSTPERRDGRKRSPYRGDTVAWPTVAPLPSYDRMEDSEPLTGATSTVQDPFVKSDP